MLDFIKYLPVEFEWRYNHHYCVPRGPSFARSPWTTLRLSGNRLRIKAPRHSPRRSGIKQTRVLPGHDLLEDPRLVTINSMPNDHWGCAVPLTRHWAFWGPWMSGCKAELFMAITVVGRQPEHAFGDLSFFHPRAFEMVLVQYLNDSYGHRRWGDEGPDALIPRRHGPADWQRHNHLPVFSASCKIYNQGPDPDITNNLSYPDHLFLFPIADQYFVQVTFRQHLYSRDERHKLTYDATPVQALQDAIFNSISLELSPKWQARYNEVRAEVGHMQLTPTFAPLKWPIGAEESAAQQDSLLLNTKS